MDKELDKLCEKYIKETKDSCGELFCGCHKGECISHMDLDVCKVCLVKSIEEELKDGNS